MKIQSQKKERGYILLISLMMIVLITGLIFQFFSFSSIRQKKSGLLVSQMKIEQESKRVVNRLIASLLVEIQENSGRSSDGENPVYSFKNNALPLRWIQKNPIDYSKSTESELPFRSSPLDPRIWSKSGLLNSTPNSPEWRMIDNAPESHSATRYAYVLYNVGQLINLNTLRKHPTSSLELNTKKGLYNFNFSSNSLLGALNLDKLYSWMNPHAIQFNEANHDPVYGEWIPAEKTEFLSRGDLLNYLKTVQNAQEASPYLTHTHWSSNQIKISPSSTRPRVAQSKLTYSFNLNVEPSTRLSPSGPYGSDAYSQDDKINPDFMKYYRKGITFQKFNLWYLSLLEEKSLKREKIYQKFGLTPKEPGVWIYNHGDASRIKTLDEVIAENREPDFFELLKSAIHVGALGRAGSPTEALNSNAVLPAYQNDPLVDLQILKIGANLIDSWDADSYPTEIAFNGKPAFNGKSTPIYGDENLAKIYRVFANNYVSIDFYRGAAVAAGWPGKFAYMTQVAVWNPFNPVNSGKNPIEYVIYADSNNYSMGMKGYYKNTNADWTAALSDGPNLFDTMVYRQQNSALQFTDKRPSLIQQPVLLTRKNECAYLNLTTTNATVQEMSEYLGNVQIGLTSSALDRIRGSIHTNLNDFSGLFGLDSPSEEFGIDIQMGYKHPQRGFVLFDHSPLFTSNSINNIGYNSLGTQFSMFTIFPFPLTGPLNYVVMRNSFFDSKFSSRIDPRSDRFGWITGRGSEFFKQGLIPFMDYSTLKMHTFFPDFTTKQGQDVMYDNSSLNYPKFGFNYNGPGPLEPNWGYLVENSANGIAYYDDPDGVVRRGLCAYEGVTNYSNRSNPMATNNVDARPVVLNRPFQSIAEIGYSGADAPWKNIDLFTPESPHAALLDVFQLNPNMDEEDSQEWVPKAISINTAYPELLSSLIVSCVKTKDRVIPQEESLQIAKAISESVRSSEKNKGPVFQKSEIVGKWIGKGEGYQGYEGISHRLKQAFADPGDFQTKNIHESYLRGITDDISCDTFNLMFDLVIEKGTIGEDKEFRTNDRLHQWVFLTIDPKTNKIVKRRIESLDH